MTLTDESFCFKRRSFSQNGPQGGSLLDYRVDMGDGSYQQRFVMSLDPAVRGVTFNAHAPAKR